MSDTNNITLTTKYKKRKIVFRDRFTALDQERIDAEHYKTEKEGDLPSPQRANRKTIEILVVSVDGKTENVVEDFMGMDYRDYVEAMSVINDISSDKITPAKKKNSANDT